MATGWIVSLLPSSLSKPAKTVEDQSNAMCSVCLEEFRDPKLLPCCHTFCTECLEGLVTKLQPAIPTIPPLGSRLGSETSQVQDEITCPQCRARHILPSQGGVRALLADFTVIQEQEKRQWQRVLEKKNRCGVCEHDGVTVSFCEDCESFLCSYCAGAHRRMKVFSSHRVISLSSSEFQNIKPKPKPIGCQIHPDHYVSFYCATCCQLICNECVATKVTTSNDEETASPASTMANNDHRLHVIHNLSESSLISLERKLSQLLSSVSEQKEDSQKKLALIDEKEKCLASHTEQLKKALIKQVEQHIKELREQCERDLKQIDKNAAATLEGYRQEKYALTEKISKLVMKERFASKAQNCSGRIPKIAMVVKAASELEKSEASPAKEIYFSSFSASPFNFYFNKLPLVVRDLGEEIKAGLTRSIKGSDFTCNTSTPDSLKLGSKCQVMVKASVQPVGTPQFRVVYGNSNRILKTTVQQLADGSWLLECTPICTGPTHQIRVCVFGHWITSSVPTFTVEGQLKVGDIVRRGPDPKSTVEEFLKSKGEDVTMASQYKVGKLTKVIYARSRRRGSPKYELEVTWGHESEKPLIEEIPSSTWNEVFGFPIELAL